MKALVPLVLAGILTFGTSCGSGLDEGIIVDEKFIPGSGGFGGSPHTWTVKVKTPEGNYDVFSITGKKAAERDMMYDVGDKIKYGSHLNDYFVVD